jgi:hypothetical protein
MKATFLIRNDRNDVGNLIEVQGLEGEGYLLPNLVHIGNVLLVDSSNNSVVDTVQVGW